MEIISIEKYKERLSRVIEGVKPITSKIISENKERIIDLNRETQLFFDGIDSKGKLLQGYTNFTISIKRLKGQVFNRTTLKNTGDFYNSFRLEYDSEKYIVKLFATDEKTPKLIAKYGMNIFGLTPDNRNYLDLKIIKPELDKWIYSKL